MLTSHLTKSILARCLFTRAIRSVYSTSPQQTSAQQSQTPVPQITPPRQLKGYQRLFSTPPSMTVNMDMILAINELRPKATLIIAIKNGLSPNQVANSTYNVVECINYIQAQGGRYYYRTFPALCDNITRILSQKIDFAFTGIFKPNAIKRLVHMISSIDSINGEAFVESIALFLVWSLENSIKTKHMLTELIIPLRSRLRQVQEKRKTVSEQKKQETSKTLQALDNQIYNLETQISKIFIKNKFIKEEDFLCALHYCLQKGYYSETIVKQFIENILEKNNYAFPDFQAFLQEEEDFFPEKPLTGMYNRKALIYCRMYNNAVYRIKILNEIKKMKLHDSKFMDFVKMSKQAQTSDASESSSEDSPFIDGKKIEETSSSESQSEQKVDQLSGKLIEEWLIPKKAYLNLVSSYLELFQRKDILCYLLSQQSSSQSLRIMQTQFFQYLKEQTNKAEGLLTLKDVKSRYLETFKQIFNIQKNGLIYVQSPLTQGAFEVILRMYDYYDRKEVFELLRLYERYLVSKNGENIKSLAPFYVFEKYGYKSNLVGSRLFQYVNFKYRVRDEAANKEEVIVNSLEICRYLSLYFKLLEGDIPSLVQQSQFGLGQRKAPKADSESPLLQTPQFKQATDIFLHNYNKLISAVYLRADKSSFIGKGLELSSDCIRLKYLVGKPYETPLTVDGKTPEYDIRKIIFPRSKHIKKHRESVKNVYEGQFKINDKAVEKIAEGERTGAASTPKIQLNFNPFVQTIFSKRDCLLNPLDQIANLLEIIETAISIQALKNVEYYEDVVAVFKNIFENEKVAKLLTNQITFPEILKRIIRITQIFKGSHKNEGNKLFESIFNLTKFNLNNFLHTARINIAREVMNADRSVMVDEAFQPYMHTLEVNPKIEPNMRIWPSKTYQITKENVMQNIRSDILHLALTQNMDLQKTIRDQLAKIKTIKPSDHIKKIKFQLNYLQYPYLANVAINKSNELTVIMLRRQTAESDKPHNAVLNKYYKQCEKYFEKKGIKVVVIRQESEIRNTLRELVK